MRAKETAASIADAWCKQNQFQLLDETVVLKKISFRRNSSGRVQFLRKYQFEYALMGSDQRFSTEIELLGEELLSMHNEKPEEKIVTFSQKKH